jgi:NADPH:quinone reductase-like Zn-dependent oxidoreductase
MLALRFERTGSLDFLQVRDTPKPAPGPSEVLVQIKAAAVNPSDVKNVLGKMHETTLPRTPGRDFSGIVAEGPPALIGQSVFGSGGDLGFKRDGSHAEFLTVPATAVSPMPRGFSFEQAAAVGVAYLTAWSALVTTAQLQPGETVLILGTTGAVGSAAAAIARRRGARVLGTVRKTSELPAAREMPVDDWINLETTDLPAGVRTATNGKGANVVFDLVGGPMFEKCLSSLAWRGRQIAISSSPEPRVTFNLVDFYHNESRLLGLDSVKITFEQAGQILRDLTPGFESGEFSPPALETFPLAEAPDVYRKLNAGQLKVKAILKP